MRILIENYSSLGARTLERKLAHYVVSKNVEAQDITVHIGPFTPNLKDTNVLDESYYIRKNYIFCEHKYKVAKWQVEINGFEDGKTDIKINSNLFGWWVFPGGTIYSIIMFKLALKGYAMLHASGVAKGGKAYIFTGRSGTGKTITVFNLLKNGFDYLGDDSTILGRGCAFSFIKPLNIRFTYDVGRILGIRFNSMEKKSIFFKNVLKRLSMGYINLFTKVDIKDLFPERVGASGSLSKIFFMVQSGSFSIKKSQNLQHLVGQLLINMQFELDELTGYLLAYSYIYPRSHLTGFWENVEKIIEESINIESAYLMDVPRKYSLKDFDLLLKKIDETN